MITAFSVDAEGLINLKFYIDQLPRSKSLCSFVGGTTICAYGSQSVQTFTAEEKLSILAYGPHL